MLRVLLVAALVLPVLGVATTAQAAPTLRQVQKRIEKLEHEAEQATERYNLMRERTKSLSVRINAAKTRVARQQRQVDAARAELGKLAAETYKAGDFSALSLFFGDDPDALLAQSGVVATLSERQAAAIARLQAEQRQLEADTADVRAQAKRLEDTGAEMRAARKTVLVKLAAAKAELNRLRASQRAALIRASRNGEQRTLSQILGRPVNGRINCREAGVTAPNARVKRVLDYACAQLGKPYRWGGEGPNSFDCSGLTMRAWQQAGVSLPHNAAMQSRYGTRVSAENLRPGDLVFFNRSISHMGIYIGNDLMLHAPRTGDVVHIAPMRYHTLVAATRL